MADGREQPGNPVTVRPKACYYWLAALVAGGVTGRFNANFILEHFYHHGPYLYDTGWLATLVYQTTPLLPNPISINGDSYLSTHFSPILYLISLPSNWGGLPLPVYYALIQGFTYGLVAFAGTLCSKPLAESLRGGPVVAALFGLGLGFSGITLSAVSFPHFEVLFCGWAILFLALLLQGKWRRALGPFILALLVREDCGLHLFGILFLLLGVAYVIPEWRSRRRALAAFMAAALGYSILVIVLQKLYFPGDNALQRIYLGDPLFHHVTGTLLGRRALYYLEQGKYIWIPQFLLLAAAIGRRSLVLLCGFLAFLPWMIFNFIANSESAGQLFAYYAYPLILALIWPALTYAADPRRLSPARTAILQAAMLGSSLILFWVEQPARFDRVMAAGFSRQEFHLDDYRNAQNFIIALGAQNNHQVFDRSVTALFPKDIAREKMRDSPFAQSADVLVGYFGGYEAGPMLALALRQGPWHQYAVAGLPLYVLSKKPLPPEMLAQDGVTDLGFSMLPPNLGLLLGDNSQAQRQIDGSIRDDHSYAQLQNIVYGPYVPLPPGQYTLTFEMEFAAAAVTDRVVCDVATRQGQNILEKTELTGAGLSPSANPVKVSLTFNSTNPDDQFEFRVAKQGAVHLLIKSYTLVKADSPSLGNVQPGLVKKLN